MKIFNYSMFIVAIMLILANDIASQTPIVGTWEIVQHKSVFNGETRVNYEKGNQNSLWNLSQILVEFQENGSCNVTDINGKSGKCSWSLSDRKLIINDVESVIDFINKNEYITRHPYEFIGLDGKVETAMMVITTRRKSPTAITAINKVSSIFNIYPDPATTEIKLEFTSTSTNVGKIHVTDALGKTVKVIELPIQEGLNVMSINISHLVSGIYALALFDGKNRYAQKFIKN